MKKLEKSQSLLAMYHRATKASRGSSKMELLPLWQRAWKCWKPIFRAESFSRRIVRKCCSYMQQHRGWHCHVVSEYMSKDEFFTCVKCRPSSKYLKKVQYTYGWLYSMSHFKSFKTLRGQQSFFFAVTLYIILFFRLLCLLHVLISFFCNYISKFPHFLSNFHLQFNFFSFFFSNLYPI